MRKKILLIILFNLILFSNIMAFNLNIKGGLAYKQDVTEEISSTDNSSTTTSDSPTQLALDTELSFYKGSNIEVGAGAKYAFLTISEQAADDTLSDDMLLTAVTAYGMFKINYSAFDNEGNTMSSSPYMQLNVGLPASATDGGDTAYTLVGKSFYEICFGIEYLDTLFEVSYANSKYEIDEQTDLTYIDVETINLKFGVKLRLFEGGE